MKDFLKGKANNEKTDGRSGRICLSLFWEFLKIGIVTIGGGMAMIPQLQYVVVEDKKWMGKEEMIDCIAVSQALPGVIAINAATYIGMRLRGLRGALSSTLGVVTPSFVIIILVVTLLENIGENTYVQGAFTGIKAAVCGLILVTVIRLGKTILKSWFSWLMAAAAFAVIILTGISVVWAILAGAVIGIVYNTVRLKMQGKSANPETDMADSVNDEASDADDEPCKAANTVSDMGDCALQESAKPEADMDDCALQENAKPEADMSDCALQENAKPEADMSDCALHEEKNKKMKSPGRGGEVKR